MELDSGNGDVAGKPHKHASGENNTMPSGSTQPLSSDNETMHIQRALASEVCFCELERHISVPPHLEHLEQAVNDVNTESSQECIPQSH
jgi:hypothetical protein